MESIQKEVKDQKDKKVTFNDKPDKVIIIPNREDENSLYDESKMNDEEEMKNIDLFKNYRDIYTNYCIGNQAASRELYLRWKFVIFFSPYLINGILLGIGSPIGIYAIIGLLIVMVLYFANIFENNDADIYKYFTTYVLYCMSSHGRMTGLSFNSFISQFIITMLNLLIYGCYIYWRNVNINLLFLYVNAVFQFNDILSLGYSSALKRLIVYQLIWVLDVCIIKYANLKDRLLYGTYMFLFILLKSPDIFFYILTGLIIAHRIVVIRKHEEKFREVVKSYISYIQEGKYSSIPMEEEDKTDDKNQTSPSISSRRGGEGGGGVPNLSNARFKLRQSRFSPLPLITPEMIDDVNNMMKEPVNQPPMSKIRQSQRSRNGVYPPYDLNSPSVGPIDNQPPMEQNTFSNLSDYIPQGFSIQRFYEDNKL